MSFSINKLQLKGRTLEEALLLFKKELERLITPLEDYPIEIINGDKYIFMNGEWTSLLDEVVVRAKKIEYTNVRGFVKAEQGIRLRDGDENYVGDKRDTIYSSATEVLVLYEGKKEKLKGWLRIKTPDNHVGWIEKQFIKIIPKDALLDSYTKKFYYIKPNDSFEENIAAVEYNDYKTRTGDDYRNIAQAFLLLNQESDLDDGIIINKKFIFCFNIRIRI